MDTKQLVKIMSGSWQEELKKLPKYQRKQIVKAYKILSKLDKLKFGIINLQQLKEEIDTIVKPISNDELDNKIMEILGRCTYSDDLVYLRKYIRSLLET